jgi:hypothetical protein
MVVIVVVVVAYLPLMCSFLHLQGLGTALPHGDRLLRPLFRFSEEI